MRRILALLLTLLLAAAARADITSNLQGHWTLDEGTGTTANDTGGGGHHLTLVNSPTWPTGKVGNYGLTCANISSQYGNVASWSAIEGTNARSFGFWFKSVASAINQYQLSYGNSTGTGTAWRIGIESGVIWLRCQACTRSWGTGTCDGQWHHICITLPASGKIEDAKCYLDAVLLTPSATTGTGSAINTAASTTFYLGYDFAGSGYWDGSLDDVYAFQRELSASDVLELFLLGKATISDPIAWWKLDETSGTTAANSGSLGASGDGTYTNSPTLGVTGAFGTSNAATFASGGSQYVACIDDASLDSLPLTVSCWLKTTSTSAVNPIVNKYVAGSNNGWFFYLNNGKPLAWYYVTGARYTSNSTSTASLKDGSWHAVVIVFSTSGCELYVDGALSSEVAWSGASGQCTTTQVVNIAKYATLGTYGDATVDDVRIYNTAKDAREVYALYTYTGASAIAVPRSRLINLGINPAKQSRSVLVNH